jgi:hypothetical protein
MFVYNFDEVTMMNRELDLSKVPSTHAAETQKPTTENVRERAHSWIENIIHEEPRDDSPVVWQYSVMNAEKAVACEEYHEAERLYLEAWRSLPKENRNGSMMHHILGPLVSLYQAQKRHDESLALQQNIICTLESDYLGADDAQDVSILDKYLPVQWVDKVLKGLPALLKLLRQTDPVICLMMDHMRLLECSEVDAEVLLKILYDICEGVDYWYGYEIITFCHAVKAREHTLKMFLVGTAGVQEERNEKAAEIIKAREVAKRELAYYKRNFGRLTSRLVDLTDFAAILRSSLCELSEADKAKLEQYKEICQHLSQKDEEEWERLPIVELLDIAEAYLPGLQRSK